MKMMISMWLFLIVMLLGVFLAGCNGKKAIAPAVKASYIVVNNTIGYMRPYEADPTPLTNKIAIILQAAKTLRAGLKLMLPYVNNNPYVVQAYNVACQLCTVLEELQENSGDIVIKFRQIVAALENVRKGIELVNVQLDLKIEFPAPKNALIGDDDLKTSIADLELEIEKAQ